MAGHILTSTGRYFYFDRPEEHPYTAEEIAHSLSHICRFTGHVRKFYSVAQHSVLVSSIVPEEFAMEALLHDASEAYLGDVSSPLKAMLPDYRAIEKRVEQAIAMKFNLRFPMSSEVKHADMRMLMTEKRDLMTPEMASAVLTQMGMKSWPSHKPIDKVIRPMTSEAAKDLFMARWTELKAKELNDTSHIDVWRAEG